MIEIKKTNEVLCINGHANNSVNDKTEETTQACACVTAMSQMLLNGIEYVAHDNIYYEIDKGHFLLDIFHLKKEDSFLLLDSFMFTAKLLQRAYPDCITVSE